MGDLQIFKNEEFGEVRTILIDGEIWFVGRDIASILGYSDPSATISKKCKHKRKEMISHCQNDKVVKTQTTLINEGDLYRLITGSKLPSAQKFEEWVMDEVLPSIRKHGAYMTDDILERTLSDPDFMIGLLTNLKEEKEKRKLAEQRTEKLIHNNKTYTATEIGKELGFKSATAFNKDLESKKIQYKINGTWVLNARYSDKDYVDIKQTELDNGSIIYNRRWTGLGRDWLINEIYKQEK